MTTYSEALRDLAKDLKETNPNASHVVAGAADELDNVVSFLNAERERTADLTKTIELHDRIHHYIGQTFKGAGPTELPALLDRMKRDLDEAHAKIAGTTGPVAA